MIKGLQGYNGSKQTIELTNEKKTKKLARQIEICGYKWTVKFVEKDHEMLGGKCDGLSIMNSFTILVRKDIDLVMQKCVLRHEITHAILCVSGRWYQNKFDKEDLCEFVAFYTPLIEKLTKQVFGE